MVSDKKPSNFSMDSTPKQSKQSTRSNPEYNDASKFEQTNRLNKNSNSHWKNDTEKTLRTSLKHSFSSIGVCNNDEALKKLYSDYKVFENWCSITYHEFHTQIGEAFHVTNNSLTVNVNNNNVLSNNTNFHLGSLPNKHRNKISEQIKKNIGTGIVMYLQTNGDVWLRQLCGEDVFVKSNYLTKYNRRTNNKLVQQICTHAYNKVFSLNKCFKKIKRVTNAGLKSTLEVKNFEKFYTLYVSFGEGWGKNYPRKTIHDTPCWIKVQLHPPSKLLDILLNQ